MKQYHYYGASIDTWVTGSTIKEVSDKLKANSANKIMFIIKVPLSIDSNYSISFFVPQVVGISLKQGSLKLFKACCRDSYC